MTPRSSPAPDVAPATFTVTADSRDIADDEIVVWRYQREEDDAWLYQEDRYALDYFDGEAGSVPEPVIVKRQWYETLPEDPGP